MLDLGHLFDEFVYDLADGFSCGFCMAPYPSIIGFADVNGDAAHSDGARIPMRTPNSLDQ